MQPEAKRYFCTYFDHNYLTRGLACYYSLLKHSPSAHFFILCLDEQCLEALRKLNLPQASIIGRGELEAAFPQLLAAKPTRSILEYYLSMTPFLPLHVLRQHPEIELLTYIDADLFFFQSPEPLFTQLGNGSISIIQHNFVPHLAHFNKYGIYNVGWVSFRHDANALACLQWWADRCVEWCYIRYEAGKFADQRYLDSWPHQFKGVVVLNHKGANLAPWNVGRYTVRSEHGQTKVDDAPLIFYHFHGLKHLAGHYYHHGLTDYGYQPSGAFMQAIYSPYFAALAEAVQIALDHQVTPVGRDSLFLSRAPEPHMKGPEPIPGFLRRWKRSVSNYCGFRAGRAVVFREAALHFNQQA